MQRARENFENDVFQTCLRYTIKEDRLLTEEEKLNVTNCYVKMAKSYRIIQNLNASNEGLQKFNRKFYQN